MFLSVVSTTGPTFSSFLVRWGSEKERRFVFGLFFAGGGALVFSLPSLDVGFFFSLRVARCFLDINFPGTVLTADIYIFISKERRACTGFNMG